MGTESSVPSGGLAGFPVHVLRGAGRVRPSRAERARWAGCHERVPRGCLSRLLPVPELGARVSSGAGLPSRARVEAAALRPWLVPLPHDFRLILGCHPRRAGSLNPTVGQSGGLQSAHSIRLA